MNDFSNFSLNDDGRQEATGISSRSKRITKTKKKNVYEESASRAPTRTSSNKKKEAKYDTFTPQEQEIIMMKIKEETEKICGNQVWHEAFLAFEPDQYRPILDVVIQKLRPEFRTADRRKEIQMWRKVTKLVDKKVKGVPERRGSPIILDDELPEFTKEVENIVKTLKNKNFPNFRKRILPVIERIRGKAGRAFNPKAFQKHKWSKFINKPKHTDLRALWALVERTSAKNSSKIEEEQDNTDELCDNTTMASSNDHSPLSSDGASPQGMEEVIENTANVNPVRIPTFEESFEMMMKMTPVPCPEDFPQSQGIADNFPQAPQNQFGQENGGGMGYVREKILLEYDDTDKLKVFGKMKSGAWEWDF